MAEKVKTKKDGFNQELYDMLKKCSDNEDATKWNEWYKQLSHKYTRMKTLAPLAGAFLEEAKLNNTMLNRTNLSGANLNKSSLHMANLSFSNLRGASFNGATLYYAFMKKTNFSGASLNRAGLRHSILSESNFSGADLSNADLTGAQLTKSILTNATLTGAIMYGTARDDWKINGVKCDYIYWDEEGKIKTPKDRNFMTGEFEKLYKQFPTIEFVFENGMTVLDPAILGAAIDEANNESPEMDLRLLSLDGRGELPRAIIEVAEKVSKKDAIALLDACYNQKVEQMQKEINGLKGDKESLLSIVSNKMLIPAIGMNSEPTKRGDGDLFDQVEQLLKSSKPTITAKDIAETLNKTYAGVYTDTSKSSVLKCEAWKTHRKLLKNSRKR